MPNELTQEDELNLIRLAQWGSISARNKLIENHLSFIHYWVGGMVAQNHYLYDDLIQDGVLGDIKGIHTFDYTRSKVRYHAYGYWWIRAFIKKTLMSEFKVLNNQRNGKWTDDGLLDVFETFDDKESINIASVIPLDSIVVVNPQDIIVEYESGRVFYELDLVEEILRITNGQLTSIQKQIMRMYFRDGHTNKQIGEILGFSGRWVGVLKFRALDAIRGQVNELLSE